MNILKSLIYVIYNNFETTKVILLAKILC